MFAFRNRMLFLMTVAVLQTCELPGTTTCAQTAPPVAWNQFRGRNGSGIGVDADPPVSFGKTKNLLWSRPVLSGACSPCIWGDRIFLSGYQAETGKLVVGCRDRHTGKGLWRSDVEAKEIESIHFSSSPASATICTDGTRIYAYFGSCGLLCFDFEGNLVWKIEMPLPGLKDGTGTSPIVAGDLVLLNRESQEDSYLIAVDKVTGAEIWKQPHEINCGSGTPIIRGDAVIVHAQAGVKAFALSDGELIWQVLTSSNGVSTPVIGGNTLFVSSYNILGDPVTRGRLSDFDELLKHDKDNSGSISKTELPGDLNLFQRPESSEQKGKRLSLRWAYGKIDVDQSGDVSREEWNEAIKFMTSQLKDNGLIAIELGQKGNISETHTSVLSQRGLSEVSSPLVHDGRIYTIADGGRLHCYDVNTRELLYEARLRARGSYFASPVAVKDRIYLTSNQGAITVIRAADEFHLIAANDLGERTLATPAIVDDTLYVRTDRRLYAFRETELN